MNTGSQDRSLSKITRVAVSGEETCEVTGDVAIASAQDGGELVIRGNVTLAPANSHGIKQLLQALKRGEAIGVLPDQAPLAGEGEWAPFFGRPADTMTLASKLANKTGATVFMAFGERLSRARGYHIHIKELNVNAISTPTLLNSEIENQIKQCPAQYLWSYTRYKSRRGPPQI